MTTHSRVKSSLVSLKGILADLDRMSQETRDPRERETFQRAHGELLETRQALEDRLEAIQAEEPQYQKAPI